MVVSRRAVWAEARPICIVHNATAQYPFAMVDAAAVSPATGHAVTTFHDLRFSIGPKFPAIAALSFTKMRRATGSGRKPEK